MTPLAHLEGEGVGSSPAAIPSQTEAAVSARLRVVAAAYEIVPSLGDSRSVRTIISAPPPARHHNLCGLEYHLKERGMIADEQTTRSSGFILSDGTYADRKRAAQVAIAAGQTTAEKMTVKGTLFSEDLW